MPGSPPKSQGRFRQRSARPNVEGPRKESIPELVGPADHPQRPVEDGHAVAQAFGLLEPMRGQKDRHALFAKPDDQLMDLAGCDGVEARGRLVQEQHARIAQQRSRQGHALTKTLREHAARIVPAVAEVDRLQRAFHPFVWLGHFVEIGEALEVLDHAQAQVKPRRFRHDRDPAPDLHAVLGRQRIPATVAWPVVGSSNVQASERSSSCRRRSAPGNRIPRRSRSRTTRPRTRCDRRNASSG